MLSIGFVKKKKKKYIYTYIYVFQNGGGGYSELVTCKYQSLLSKFLPLAP